MNTSTSGSGSVLTRAELLRLRHNWSRNLDKRLERILAPVVFQVMSQLIWVVGTQLTTEVRESLSRALELMEASGGKPD